MPQPPQLTVAWPGKADAEALLGSRPRARWARREADGAPGPASGAASAEVRGASAVEAGPGGKAGEGSGGVRVTQDDNVLVEADNLEALWLLQDSHAGAVKVVYIDPPYNTGNALPYKDTFGQAGHAGWLSMMLPRLALTKDLLRSDGTVFVQVDDTESAYVTLLGNEIFGEENYLGAFVHQRAKGGGNAKRWVRGHDYIHVWARDITQVGPFVREKQPPARYETIDGERYLVEDDFLRVSFGKYTRGSERRLMYEDIVSVRGEAKKAEIDAGIAMGRYVLRPWGDTGKHAVVRLTPADRASSKMYSIVKALGETGRRDLEALGLGGTFGYPKPVELLTTLVLSQTFEDRDAIVLDFFAGSGTTGEAVLALNARDGGNRRFVLVQRPEALRPVAGARTGAEGTGGIRAAGDDAAEPIAFVPGTISALCRERVRRAGARLRAEHPELVTDFLDLTVVGEGPLPGEPEC
ncbi:site-specific DNA-methyltransferase [Brevibacterium samyangense]|uniref:DNA methylase N-4/N-6 domain-containing protein n=1 Tax=Brevibacterium samyangense TaxID=366888 RepID=A0ABN2TAQ3_9MICO